MAAMPAMAQLPDRINLRYGFMDAKEITYCV